MSIKFDMSGLSKKIKKASHLKDEVIKPAYEYFKDETPIRTGNARRKTKLKKSKIKADYPYAQKLDEGWSKQSPDGMTKPTEKYLEELVTKFIKRIGKKNG